MCFTQQNTDSFYTSCFFSKIQQLNIQKAYNYASYIKDSTLKKRVYTYYDIITKNEVKKLDIKNYIKNVKKSNKTDLNKCLDYLILGEYEFTYLQNRDKSFELLTIGLQKAEKLNNDFLQIEFLLKIFDVYRFGIADSSKNMNTYLKKLKKLATKKEYCRLLYYKNKIYTLVINGVKFDHYEKKQTLREQRGNALFKLDSVFKKLDKKSLLKVKYYQIKGLDLITKQNYDEAISSFKKIITLLENEKNPFFNAFKYNAFKEIARTYNKSKKYKKALKNLQASRKYESKDSIRNKFIYNLYVSDIYSGLKKHDSAFITMKKAFHYSLSLNFKQQNNLISSLEVKNKTKQKEIENLQLKQENTKIEMDKKQTFSLFIGSLALLGFVGIIFILLLKVSNKKRLLAEQQKEVETQKNFTLLKEQEINAINAMVEGQEKERKRIAEDLHDNIGSVLATLKLHFENLKLNKDKKHFNQDELYERTEKLIDETYLKVRNIAHQKNAGVIANQGLLSAIKVMSEKISSANKLNIEVVSFGLNKRLETSLEITIFRIIQELITNIIKHAEAKNATINLSLYNNILNLIIEDNGKGFDVQKIKLNKGVGLSSIKTRIKHLNGTFKIDSTPNHGTSIIMDIPLK